MTINNVVLTGRISFEPNMFKTKKGGVIANFILGVYAGKKDDKNAYYNIPVKVFDNDMATLVEQVGKGGDVTVVGKIASEQYEKDGKKVTNVVVYANHIAN